jgi:enamine deaminase RidA (YjgF/YER057c/UK114 family)
VLSGRSSIENGEAPPPGGAYSQGIRFGDLLFLAGQGPFDATGAPIGGSVAAQTRQAFANLDAVARAAGSSLAKAVRVGVYLSNLEQFVEIDAVIWLGD